MSLICLTAATILREARPSNCRASLSAPYVCGDACRRSKRVSNGPQEATPRSSSMLMMYSGGGNCHLRNYYFGYSYSVLISGQSLSLSIEFTWK